MNNLKQKSKTKSKTRSRLALLATLGELHTAPLYYDLQKLKAIVSELSPDLLCAEITLEQWEKGNLSNVGIEVREALLPVAVSSDIVVVPIAASQKQFSDYLPAEGWRRNMGNSFVQILDWGATKANTPTAVNGLLFESFCHTVCKLNTMTWLPKDQAQWEKQNAEMAENILQAIKRDIGRRVLVVAQCQRVHKLQPLLEKENDLIEIVHYQDL